MEIEIDVDDKSWAEEVGWAIQAGWEAYVLVYPDPGWGTRVLGSAGCASLGGDEGWVGSSVFLLTGPSSGKHGIHRNRHTGENSLVG